MGWGVTYPSPHGTEPEDDRYECEGKACQNLIERGDEVSCERAGCTREALCEGCSYQCGLCSGWFCREHIVEHKSGLHMADYACHACDRKRELEQEAA